MKLNSDFRKIRAVLILGLGLFLASGLSYIKLEGTSMAVWTWFFSLSGLVFIAVGFLVRSRFELTDNYLELKNVLGFSKKRVYLSEIIRTKSINKGFPITAYNNPLWFILTDKKFKRINKISLFGIKGKLLTVDGHLLKEKDYELLKRKLKKPTYNKL